MSSTAKSGFTPLERTVLDWICKRSHEEGVALAVQISSATIRSRENTGHGFYTRFDVDRISTGAIGGKRSQDLRDGPQAKIAGLQHGMGFILWLRDGYATHLEGYGYEEDIAGFDLWDLAFELSSPE